MSEEVDDFLAHYGVKGMRWGVRRDDHPGASRKVNREARKDAEEFARAKMFYGTGAGNRRKLIKSSVEAKSQKDESYKQAFDHHLAKQDMADHAAKAQSERRRKDVTSTTAKTARGVHRQLTGGFGGVSLASAVIAGAYLSAKATGVDQVLIDTAKKQVSTFKNKQNDKKKVDSWMKQNGFL